MPDSPRVCSRCGYDFEPFEEGACPRCAHLDAIYQQPEQAHAQAPHAGGVTDGPHAEAQAVPHHIEPANPTCRNPTPINVGMQAAGMGWRRGKC